MAKSPLMATEAPKRALFALSLAVIFNLSVQSCENAKFATSAKINVTLILKNIFIVFSFKNTKIKN